MVKIHQENVKCEIHKEKGIEEEGYFSCEICQKWMCEECINNHIKEKKDHYYYIIRRVTLEDNNNTMCRRHNLEYSYYVTEDFMYGYHICDSCEVDYNDPDQDIIRIPKEKGECYFNQLKQILKDGVEYLDTYCQNIYNHLINSIKGNQNLEKKAKEIYDKFLIRNRRVLFYFQMVINTGTPSLMNYNLIGNISSSLLTKFDRINISSSEKLNAKEIDEILKFFENNYIVGTSEQKLEDIKNIIDIKEINTIKKEEDKKIELADKENEEETKIKFIDIIVLDKNLIIGGSDNGDIHLFEIDYSFLNGKCILSIKAHEKQMISLDKIKNTKNKFVTCDEKDIKLWALNNVNNNYIVSCETVLKELSNSDLNYLYVLNSSNNISFLNENNKVTILNEKFQPFFKVDFETSRLNALYQIDSDDENNLIFVIGGRDIIILYKIFEGIKCIGSLECGCFSGKSFCYLGNSKLLIGGINNIYMTNIKDMKLEYIIKLRNSECTCFLQYNNKILCGYGDTSGCSCWSMGIATDKTTKFLILKSNKEKYEEYLIKDDFYDFGITNAIWIDKDKFISFFYNDNSLKIFQIK